MGTSEEVRGQGQAESGRKHTSPGGRGQMGKEPRSSALFLMAVGSQERELWEGHAIISSEFGGGPSDYKVGIGWRKPGGEKTKAGRGRVLVRRT